MNEEITIEPESEQPRQPFNIEDLYNDYLSNPNDIPDYETFLEKKCSNLSEEQIRQVTKEIGFFLVFNRRIYADVFRLDEETTTSLPEADSYIIKDIEFISLEVGETSSLVRLDALEELAEVVAAGKYPHRSRLYHSTTCAITDSLLQEGALLAASKLKEKGSTIRSGEALTNDRPYRNLSEVYAGGSPEQRFMRPRWFSLEERGLGFLFNPRGLEEQVEEFTFYSTLDPDNTFGTGIAPEVPINDRTVTEINYDIEAKQFADKIAQKLGLEDVLLVSIQARNIFFSLVDNMTFNTDEELSDYLKTRIMEYHNSSKQSQEIEVPIRKRNPRHLSYRRRGLS